MGTLVGFKRGSRGCFLAGYGAFISLDRGVHVWSGVTSQSFYRKMLEWWQSRFFECVKTFIPFHMRRTRKYAIALEHWMLMLNLKILYWFHHCTHLNWGHLAYRQFICFTFTFAEICKIQTTKCEKTSSYTQNKLFAGSSLPAGQKHYRRTVAHDWKQGRLYS